MRVGQGVKNVSVVIPCYNAGPFLTEAVASVFSSTHAPREVIVVDDGSTDPSTLHVLLDAEARGCIVVRQSNAGAGAARNAGARLATGDYLLLLDADDKIEPGFLAATEATLTAEPTLGFTYTHTSLFGDKSGMWRRPKRSNPHLLFWENELPSASLVRRSAWNEVGGCDETLRIHEDWDLWLKLAERGWHGVRTDGATSWYRVHAASKSRQALATRQTNVAAIQAQHPVFKTSGPYSLFCRTRNWWREQHVPRPLRRVANAVHRLYNAYLP